MRKTCTGAQWTDHDNAGTHPGLYAATISNPSSYIHKSEPGGLDAWMDGWRGAAHGDRFLKCWYTFTRDTMSYYAKWERPVFPHRTRVAAAHTCSIGRGNGGGTHTYKVGVQYNGGGGRLMDITHMDEKSMAKRKWEKMSCVDRYCPFRHPQSICC